MQSLFFLIKFYYKILSSNSTVSSVEILQILRAIEFEFPLRFVRLKMNIWNILGVIFTVIVLMRTFKTKNSLRTIEAEISKKVKKNEARPNFNGSYKKINACKS